MHSDDVECWTAARVVTQHVAGEGCGQCPTDGGDCRLFGWADARLRRWEAEHGGQYPDQAPAWSAVSRPG